MKTTSMIRLDNLNLLVEEAGGVPELAKLMGYKQPSYLYQIINQTIVQNGKAKNIGNNMAEKLERVMNKPKGWLDMPHQTQTDNSTQTLNASNIGVQIGRDNYGDVCGHTNPGNGTINIHKENNNFSEKNTINSNAKPVNPKKLTVMEALQLATPFAMKRVSEEFFEQEELPQGYSIEQAQVDTLFEYAKLILLTYPHYKYELERLSVYDDPKRIYPTD